jgi:hypothetical protein
VWLSQALEEGEGSAGAAPAWHFTNESHARKRGCLYVRVSMCHCVCICVCMYTWDTCMYVCIHKAPQKCCMRVFACVNTCARCKGCACICTCEHMCKVQGLCVSRCVRIPMYIQTQYIVKHITMHLYMQTGYAHAQRRVHIYVCEYIYTNYL